jgi:3-hydroxyacyl-CoA dehydrogenase
MKENSMQQTVVIGAGLMGIGIATHFARFHQDVLIYDTDPAVWQKWQVPRAPSSANCGTPGNSATQTNRRRWRGFT